MLPGGYSAVMQARDRGEFREEVVVRRIKFELAKARDRGHVLVGLAVAVANIDEVIHIIRSSADPAEARERLQAKAWPVATFVRGTMVMCDDALVTPGGGEPVKFVETLAKQ